MTVQPSACPSDVLDAIPWYPDEGLTDEQIAAVEVHAAECRACRQEIDCVHGAVPPTADVPLPDVVYARVMEMIAQGGHAPPRARTTPPARRRGWGGLVRATAAAAALAGAVLLGSFLGTGPETEPVYRTVASATADGAALDVVFRGDATADEIRAALVALDARVVSGPNALGAYRIALGPAAEEGAEPGSGDVGEAARALTREGSGIATFAEPVLR